MSKHVSLHIDPLPGILGELVMGMHFSAWYAGRCWKKKVFAPGQVMVVFFRLPTLVKHPLLLITCLIWVCTAQSTITQQISSVSLFGLAQ